MGYPQFFKEKKCETCGVNFTPTSGRQRNCGSFKDKTGCSARNYVVYLRKYMRFWRKNTVAGRKYEIERRKVVV